MPETAFHGGLSSSSSETSTKRKGREEKKTESLREFRDRRERKTLGK